MEPTLKAHVNAVRSEVVKRSKADQRAVLDAQCVATGRRQNAGHFGAISVGIAGRAGFADKHRAAGLPLTAFGVGFAATTDADGASARFYNAQTILADLP